MDIRETWGAAPTGARGKGERVRARQTEVVSEGLRCPAGASPAWAEPPGTRLLLGPDRGSNSSRPLGPLLRPLQLQRPFALQPAQSHPYSGQSLSPRNLRSRYCLRRFAEAEGGQKGSPKSSRPVKVYFPVLEMPKCEGVRPERAVWGQGGSGKSRMGAAATLPATASPTGKAEQV